MRTPAERGFLIWLVFGGLLGARLGAQQPDSASLATADTVAPVRAAGRIDALVTLGSTREDRLRVQQLLGGLSTHGYLIRSPSALAGRLAGKVTWQLVAPEVRSVWNSAIPLSLNDGALWAGRGANLQVLAGVRAELGPVAIILAPEAVYSGNQTFRELPASLQQRQPGRSSFSFPFQAEPASVDMPLRFGDKSYALLDPGQSSITVAAGGVAVGVATENQWWGPGIRNAIVMSNNAAGLPHAFVRTRSAVRTPLGNVEAKLIVGGLTESLFFDTISSNNLRSLNGLVATFHPAWEPNLALGAARVVYSPVAGRARVLAHSLDVLTRWERRPAVNDTTWSPESEQIISLFGRWVLPNDGFEVYTEWARFELPVSIRDALSAPNHTQGYTVGTQWARPIASRVIRLQGEATYLEESATSSYRPTGTAYTSTSVPQGYAHRGQVVGASIGPGSSSQWAAADVLSNAWNIGVSLNRIRWQNDALYSSESPDPFLEQRTPFAHDVSFLAGVRAGVALGRLRLEADLVSEKRYNYLFQNPETALTPGRADEGAVDIRNYHLELRVSPTSGP